MTWNFGPRGIKTALKLLEKKRTLKIAPLDRYSGKELRLHARAELAYRQKYEVGVR